MKRALKTVAALAAFAWDFVVGDDWRIAVAVVVALGATALLHAAGVAAWWLLPAVVAVLLTVSVRSAWRRAPPQR